MRIEVGPTKSRRKRGCRWLFTQNAAAAFESSAPEWQLDMEKASTKIVGHDIPELKGMQLGKVFVASTQKHVVQGGKAVVLKPDIQKAFATSEAVNKALASMKG